MKLKRAYRRHLNHEVLTAYFNAGFVGTLWDVKTPELFCYVTAEKKAYWHVRLKKFGGGKKTYSLCCYAYFWSSGVSPKEARELARDYSIVYAADWYKKGTLCQWCDTYARRRKDRACCLRCEIHFRYKRLIRLKQALAYNDLWALQQQLKETIKSAA